jgi:hypothetical protein
MHFGDIVTLEQAGLTMEIQQGFNGHKKDEYCDRRATVATAGIWGSRNLRYGVRRCSAGGRDSKCSADFG